MLARGLDVLWVMSLTVPAVENGTASNAIPDIVDNCVRNNFTGFMIDYEPDVDYTEEHVQQYASFLSELANQLHVEGKLLGMDVADWGILNYYSDYANTGTDTLMNMSPTCMRVMTQ